MIKRGDYGPVLITNGRFKGKVGYYAGEEMDYAKVYPYGTFMGLGQSFIMPYSYLIKINDNGLVKVLEKIAIERNGAITR